VRQPVEAGVPLADLPLLGVFNFPAILHGPEFRRAGGWASIGGRATTGVPGLVCGQCVLPRRAPAIP
jgi:hypothetical protein